jgi:hypothetical protein
MPAAGLVVALLIVASIVGTVALWYVIDSETDDNPRMDRTDAERVARHDHAGGDVTAEDGDDESSDDWGTDDSWGVDDETGR